MSNTVRDINDDIEGAENRVRRFCSQNGKWGQGFRGFAKGLEAMIGISGIPGINKHDGGGDKATDMLKSAETTLQTIYNTSSLRFAQLQVKLDSEYLQLMEQNQNELYSRINILQTIQLTEQQLLQIEILGAFLFIFLILLYLFFT